MTKSSKSPKQSKEQNEYKALNKKQRDLTGEIKKLKKENARLRKLANRDIHVQEPEEEVAEPKKVEVKASEAGLSCPHCNGTDIAQVVTHYNKKTLCVCKGCSYKWSIE